MRCFLFGGALYDNGKAKHAIHLLLLPQQIEGFLIQSQILVSLATYAIADAQKYEWNYNFGNGERTGRWNFEDLLLPV